MFSSAPTRCGAASSLQAYQSVIGQNTTLVLSTDSELFKYLQGMTPDGPGAAENANVALP